MRICPSRLHSKNYDSVEQGDSILSYERLSLLNRLNAYEFDLFAHIWLKSEAFTFPAVSWGLILTHSRYGRNPLPTASKLAMNTSNREQSGFAPLNVEIESESEDEIDDSKEIQVQKSSYNSMDNSSS